MRLGAIEAGGTKFVCGIGDEKGNIYERVSFPTTTPEETMERVFAFFQNQDFKAIGIGCFGPVSIDKASRNYGSILNTPKIQWKNFNIVQAVSQKFHVPVGFDTDVNAAALGELTWGEAKGLDSCIYITVGTGIGVGAVVDGRVLHGMTHPEMGHILVKRHKMDTYKGTCPYHDDCLEGLAAGPALEKRWGQKANLLTAREEVWDMEAFYLAQAIYNYILILSPKKVIIGGGVMNQKQLFPLIHNEVRKLLNNYVQSTELQSLDSYIVPPKLGQNAGLLGAAALAGMALKEKGGKSKG